MTKAKLLAATLLAAATALPAYAQNTGVSTQTPPSAGTQNEGTPQSLTSVPAGAETATRQAPGSNLGTTRVGPDAPSTTPTTPAR